MLDPRFAFRLRGKPGPGRDRVRDALVRTCQLLARPLAARPTDTSVVLMDVRVADLDAPLQYPPREDYSLAVRGGGAAATDGDFADPRAAARRPRTADLVAPTWLGALAALSTFSQLFSEAAPGFEAPPYAIALTVADAPAWPWRGLLVDVVRHFIPSVREGADADHHHYHHRYY